ncbi:MAG: superinfection immunity protein [Bacteroidota bacterium]
MHIMSNTVVLILLKAIILLLFVFVFITFFPFSLLFTLYLLPTIIAGIRNNNFSAILVLNLFLGWTLVGWVVSLSWSLASKNR